MKFHLAFITSLKFNEVGFKATYNFSTTDCNVKSSKMSADAQHFDIKSFKKYLAIEPSGACAHCVVRYNERINQIKKQYETCHTSE